MRRSVRGPRYKVLFKTKDDVLLAETAPEVSDLKGRLFDLQEDPGETTDLWSDKPEVVAESPGALPEPTPEALGAASSASTADVQPDRPFAIPPSGSFAARHARAGSHGPRFPESVHRL